MVARTLTCLNLGELESPPAPSPQSKHQHQPHPQPRPRLPAPSLTPALAALPAPPQGLKNGVQVEMPDIWLSDGNPWEVRRAGVQFDVCFGGRVTKQMVNGKETSVWAPAEKVGAVAFLLVMWQRCQKIQSQRDRGMSKVPHLV